jgi:hypothetical protein
MSLQGLKVEVDSQIETLKEAAGKLLRSSNRTSDANADLIKTVKSMAAKEVDQVVQQTYNWYDFVERYRKIAHCLCMRGYACEAVISSANIQFLCVLLL